MAQAKVRFMRSIGGKITVMFVLVVLVSLGLVAVLSAVRSSDALMDSQFEKLTAARDIKRGQIESYGAGVRTELEYLVSEIDYLRMTMFTQLSTVQALKRSEVERFFSDRDITDADLAPGGEVDQRMNEIVGSREAMGSTGETYLMSIEDGRFIFRSDMITMGDGAFVYGADQTEIAKGIEYLQLAAEGESGQAVFTDSAGELVAVVYDSLDIAGRNWIMITKKSFEESIALQLAGRSGDILSEFTDEFGYYDLFLVHPQGRIFYTVAKESDYRTNILTGKYADSSLGTAVTEAIRTKGFAFGDFRPYEPSGGQPAAFVSMPLVKGGRIELVVALQLPLDEVNSIMQERSGMGETGETYLVGQDLLMRSDSYLDPEHHSVTASFADPTKGSVDTKAARQALAGNSGQEIITDYNGNPVLSSYVPLEMFGADWALIAEIDRAEVRAPVQTLITFIAVVAVVMIAVAAVAAFLFSRSISKPILLIVEGADSLSVGDIRLEGLDQDRIAKVNARADELGEIGRSFSRLIEYQDEKTRVAQEIAAKNLAVEVEPSSKEDLLGIAFKEMVDSLNEVIGQVREAVEQVSSGAAQVSQASQSLSQGATEQASSLEEITSSLSEINSQSGENANNAAEASTVASQAAESAVSGNGRMQELQGAMERIGASSQDIKKVVKVIDDIAFQINLLALNANVEAARAGKYGQGFAVVADEVRNLAVKSADSVNETTEIVEASIKNIEEGTETAGATAEQLEQIVDGAKRVAAFLDEISGASKEQAQGVEQINSGLDQIDQVTQANTASAEESASAAEELTSQAQELKAMVAEFTIAHGLTATDHGGGSGRISDDSVEPLRIGAPKGGNGNRRTGS